MYIVAICILCVLYAWALYNIPILAVGVRHLIRSGRKGRKTLPLRAEDLPMVSIIVPVRDEGRVLDRLFDALLKLDYPAEKMEIAVVEDGSVDETVAICKEHVRRYPDQVRLIRRSVSKGKPSALNYALKYVKGEIVAVFDADNVPERDVLMRAVEYFKEPSTVAVQGRQCSINASENMLTKFISYEEAVRYEAYLRGKDALNLFVPITGSCYFVRRSVVEEIGGWDSSALSEDMDLSAKLTEKGYKVKYASDVRSWQENPANLTQLLRQRTRWFRGCMEVSLKYGRLVRKMDRRCFDAEITLVGPFVFIPFLMSYILGIYVSLRSVHPDPLYAIMAQGTMLLTTVMLCLIGMTLFCVTKPRRIANLLWLPFVYGYLCLQTFVALYALVQIVLRRPRRWTKTVKTGVATILRGDE